MTSPQRLLTIFALTLLVLTGMFTASAQTVGHRTRDFGNGRGDVTIKRTGKIAFVRSTSDEFGRVISDIYTIDSNGNNETRLTNSGSASNPAWSPDGKHIAFTEKFVTPSRTTDTRVSVMNSDGTNPRGIIVGSSNPAWSPDGSKLVVTKFIEGYGELFVVNLDGTNEINLTNSPRTYELRPAWSPDGKHIAYSSNGFLWMMNADGTNPTVLTRGGNSADYPAWSPDSARIVYQYNSCFATQSDIFIINAANGETTQLPTAPPAHSNPHFCSSRPAWSPDGKSIVYTFGEELGAELYIVNADGTAFRRLTNNYVEDSQAAWQPLVSTTRSTRPRFRISPNTP